MGRAIPARPILQLGGINMAGDDRVQPGFIEGWMHPGEIELLNSINNYMRELTVRMATLNNQSGGDSLSALALPPVPVRPTAPSPWTIQLPLKAIDLANMISATHKPGLYSLELDKFDVNVPIGATVTVRLPPRPGRVMVATSDMDMTASYYSNLITMTLQVDGVSITTSDNPFTVTGGDSIPFGPFFHWETSGLTVTLTNQSTTASLVSFRLAALAMNRDFWNTYFLPLITGGFEFTKQVAKTLNGGISL